MKGFRTVTAKNKTEFPWSESLTAPRERRNDCKFRRNVRGVVSESKSRQDKDRYVTVRQYKDKKNKYCRLTMYSYTHKVKQMEHWYTLPGNYRLQLLITAQDKK